MHVSNKIVGIAAVVVLAGAGMTAVAWAQPTAPSGTSVRSDHQDKPADRDRGHDHGLHLGHTKDHGRTADKDKGPGHDRGLRLGHRPQLRDGGPPGLSTAKHKARMHHDECKAKHKIDHRDGADKDTDD